MREHR